MTARLFLLLPLAFGFLPAAEPTPELRLVAGAQVEASGVYLDQVLAPECADGIPHVRVAQAPGFGLTTQLTRAEVETALLQSVPGLAGASWTGPETVVITRRARSLEETELRSLLTTAVWDHLQLDTGELELRFARAWTPLTVPDEPLTVEILDLPRGGLRPYLLLRFDLLAGVERLGGWQLSFQASLWQDTPVARSGLQRGQRLLDADISLERWDVLTLNDPLAPEALQDPHLELAQTLRAGQPLLARSVRVRPVIRRGGMVEGLMTDGSLLISLKVEALSDALPGQTVRVRNPRTRREFLAKVQDEQTVILLF